MRVLANRTRFYFRWRRWAPRAGIGLLALLAIGAGWLYGQLRGSLAQLDGSAVLTGLSAAATVESPAISKVALASSSHASRERPP